MPATVEIRITSSFTGAGISRAIADMRVLAAEATKLTSGLAKSASEAAATAKQMTTLASAMNNAHTASSALNRGMSTLDATLGTINGTLHTLNASLNAYTAAMLTSSRATTASRTALVAMSAALAMSSAGTRSAATAAQSYVQMIQRLGSLVASAAKMIGTMLGGALQRTGQLFGTATRSAASFFSGLRRALDGGGSLFNRFGGQVDSASKKVEKFAGAYSVFIAGGIAQGMSGGLLSRAGKGFGDYLKYDDNVTRLSIATIPVEQVMNDPNYVPGSFNNRQLLIDMIQSMQRGNIRDTRGGNMTPIYSMDANELAEGVYYLAAAAGTQLSGQTVEGGFTDWEVIAQRVLPMLQIASYTQTSPQQAVKGILSIGTQFGMNVRDMGVDVTEDLQNVAAKVALLSQQTSLEVPDIVEAFKMVGPMIHILTGKDGLAGLNESFALMAIEADAGLRGSSPGRAIAQAFTTMLDMPLVAQNTVKDIWGKNPDDVFFNEDMTLKGGPLGVISLLAALPEDQWMRVTADVFTTNASRALVAAVAQVRRNPDLLQEWTKLFEGDAATKVASESFALLNNTLASNFQHIKNGWFAVQTEIIRAVEGPLISAFRAFGNVLFDISDAVQQNPWIAHWVAGFISVATVALYAVGSILAFAGAIMILQRGLMFVGGGLMTVVNILPALLSLFTVGIPLIAGLAAAFFLLKAAWDANLLGIQDLVGAFRSDFAGSLNSYVLPTVEKIALNLLLAGAAVQDFVKIVALGQEPIGALGRLLTKVFGDLLGPRLYANVLNFGDALKGARDGIKDFFDGIGNTRASFGDSIRSIQMFFEETLLGISQMDSRVGAARFGDWLGIDNLGGKITVAARFTREGIETIVDSARMLIGILSGPLQAAWTNFTSLFSANTFARAVELLRGIAEGVGTGFATVLYGAARGLQMFTEQLTRLGDAGRAIRDQIQAWTGLQVMLQGVGRTIGVVIGALLAGRLLLAVPVLSKVALGFLQIGTTVIGVGGQLAFLGARIAVTTAAWVAYNAVQLLTQSASMAVWGINTVLSGSFTLLGSTVTGMSATLIGLTAASLGLIGVFGLVAAGIFVIVAATQGWNAAWAAATSFVAGLSATVMAGLGVFLGLAGVIAAVVGWLAGLVGSVLTANDAMYLLGAGVGLLVTMLAINATIAVGRFAVSMLTATGSVIAFSVSLSITLVQALISVGAMVVQATAAILAFVAEMIVALVALAAANLPITAAIIALLALGAVVATMVGPGNLIEGFGNSFVLMAAGIQVGLIQIGKAIESLKLMYQMLSTLARMGGEKLGLIDAAPNVDDPWKEQTDKANPSAQEAANATMQSVAQIFGIKLPAGAGWKELVKMGYEEFAGFASDITGTGGTDITSMFQDSALSQFNEGMLKYLMPEMTKFQQQVSEYEEWLKVVDAIGLPDAEALYRQMGKPIPTQPSGEDFYNSIMPAVEEAMDQAEEDKKKLEELQAFTSQMTATYSQMTLPQAMRGAFSLQMGYGTSLPEGIAMYGDTMMQNINSALQEQGREAEPWMNIYEMLADVIGGGAGAGVNVAGRNLHSIIKNSPGAQLWAQQIGIGIDELLQDVPKFVHPENLEPIAFEDLGTVLAGMPNDIYRKIDLAGQAQGWNQFGLEWADLMDYAISNAIAHKDWNLADYAAEAWGVEKEKVLQVFKENGINPDEVNSAMFDNLDMAVMSQGGEVNVFTPQWWDWFQQVTSNGADKVIEISKTAFDALPGYVKTGLSNLGYTFLVGGQETAAQAAATGQAIVDSFRDKYGDGKGGFSEIARDAETGMVTIKNALGETITVPAPEWEAYKAALDAIKKYNEDTANSFKTLKEAYKEYRDNWEPLPGYGYAGDGTDTDITPMPGLNMPLTRDQYDALAGGTANYVPGGMYNQGGGDIVPTVTPESLGLPAIDTFVTYGQEANAAFWGGFGGTGVEGSGAPAVTFDPATIIKLDDFTKLGTDAATTFVQALSAAVSDGTMAELGPGGQRGDASGGGTGLFDEMFKVYATSAATAFQNELAALLPSATMLAIQGIGAGQTAQGQADGGIFDPMFSGYGAAAAAAFQNSFSAAMAGWTPTFGAPTYGANGSQDPAQGAAPAPTSPQDITISLKLDTSQFDTSWTTISNGLSEFDNKTISTAWNFVVGEDIATNAMAVVTNLHWINDNPSISTSWVFMTGEAKPLLEQVLAKLKEVNATFTATVSVFDNASWVIASILNGLNSLPTSKTITVTTIQQTVQTQSFSPNSGDGTAPATDGSFASGGLVPFSGVYEVGEFGREFVWLPSQAYVSSYGESQRLLYDAQSRQIDSMSGFQRTSSLQGSSGSDSGGGTANSSAPVIQVRIDNVTISQEADVDAIVNRVERLIGQKVELVKRGSTPGGSFVP